MTAGQHGCARGAGGFGALRSEQQGLDVTWSKRRLSVVGTGKNLGTWLGSHAWARWCCLNDERGWHNVSRDACVREH
jgi:hypothetical protein